MAGALSGVLFAPFWVAISQGAVEHGGWYPKYPLIPIALLSPLKRQN